ncbi:hypothetical protein HYR54_00595 [Candidatus Acetothermia bacterium]|nr:hypothetical protein [Candidatus Acetothermia bacterium]
MRKLIVRGSCDRDIVGEAHEMARVRGISFSGLLERALESYLRELTEREERSATVRNSEKDLTPVR